MTAKAQILVLATCLLTAMPVSPESNGSRVHGEAEHEHASEDEDVTDREAQLEKRDPGSIVYVPPARGRVRASAGGGIRGGTRALPRPVVLAPPHVGLTERASPSLFWSLDRVPPAGASLEFVLIRADLIDPVAQHTLAEASAAGIQRIRLSELGIELEPGVEYEWSVSLVSDPSDRTRDLVSTGWLQRVEQGTAQDRAQDAQTYAQRSLWYDALGSIVDAIEASPEDTALRTQRDDLLRQAGLP